MSKRMDIKEFREIGYLQEVNRQFFHPLGLAIFTKIDKEGNEEIGGVYDFRDEEDGTIFHDDLANSEQFKEKKKYVAEQLEKKATVRKENLGYVIQE